MYYSAIGFLAMLILVIENTDILLNRNDAFGKPSWKVYRRFLFAIIIYYITDILWGILEYFKLSVALFADTTVYFAAMAAGVLLWTQYAVTYLEEKKGFGRFLIYAGRAVAAFVAGSSLLNVFVPVLFTVDGDCVYTALPFRYVLLTGQILLLVVISVYAVSALLRRNAARKSKYRTIALFGMIMAAFLTFQLWFPYLPLYSIAYLFGTCLLRAFIIGEEKEKYRRELAEAEKISVMKRSFTALLDNMPALSFSKDAETGVYLACNQSFADYAHKDTPEGVVGLTDAQIFDGETARHFVEDDRLALSMDKPYIFFENVPDAAGNQRQFQTTKLKFIDHTGRMCLLGMSADVTDIVRIKRENDMTKEAYEKARSAGVIYSHIAQTLAKSYMNLFYVNLGTGDYVEYLSDDQHDDMYEVRRGSDFFESCKIEAEKYIHPDDRAMFLHAVDRKNLTEVLDRNGGCVVTYRQSEYHLEGEDPKYVSMRIARIADNPDFVVMAVTNVDEQVKLQKSAERMNEEHIAYNRINALTGDFLSVYVIVPQTGRYREYSASSGYESLELPSAGTDFFDDMKKTVRSRICPEDLERFNALFTKEKVFEEIERGGIYSLSYRLMIEGKPLYVQLKAAMVEENEGKRLIVGINDIDAQKRREEEYEKRLSKALSMANIDALTGVKNRHAYLDAEERIDRRIAAGERAPFAIVMFDVNDLKKTNDLYGHQEGDRLLRDACRVICDVFKHSPVYRVGGDEFAVICQGSDYDNVDFLMGTIARHNEDARKNGGAVVACGMARYDNEDSVEPVFGHADRKMYENKETLKNAEN